MHTKQHGIAIFARVAAAAIIAMGPGLPQRAYALTKPRAALCVGCPRISQPEECTSVNDISWRRVESTNTCPPKQPGCCTWSSDSLVTALPGACLAPPHRRSLNKIMALLYHNHPDEKSLQKLIGSGADLNGRDDDGTTPLMLAVQSCSYKLVHLMLDHGAKVNVEDRYHATPLLYALSCNRANSAKLALLLINKGADVKSQDVLMNSPLYWAAFFGYYPVAQVILAKGVSPNVKNIDGVTPLSLAAFRGDVKLVSLLISHGAAVNFSNTHRLTPLVGAVQSNSYKELEILIAHGGKVSEPNTVQKPLLVVALRFSASPAIVKLLAKSGADVNAYNHGETPLTLAAAHSSATIIRILLEAGARADLKNGDGQTAADVAKRYNRSKAIIEMLKIHHQP